MNHPRVLVDASNLHHGGGVQVAASFLNELGRLCHDTAAVSRYPWLTGTRVEASPSVLDALDPHGLSLDPECVRHRPSQLGRWRPVTDKVDVSFVVFGPDYGAARAHRRVVGYADVTSVYPVPEGVPTGSARTRARRRVRGLVSRLLLSRADCIVVETEAFAEAVRSAVPTLRAPIEVVPNCVNGSVLARCPVPQRPRGDVVRVLYVGRAYPHKNHDLLGLVGQELDRRGHKVEFAVTLSDDQWNARSELFRRYAVNLGELSVTHVVDAYRDADAVVFPSLLEAFSIAPLEAMAAGRLVFASDRDFVRTVCGAGVEYVDPLDPVAWADVIADWIRDPAPVETRVLPAAGAVVATLTRPQDRAEAYLRLIDSELRRVSR